MITEQEIKEEMDHCNGWLGGGVPPAVLRAHALARLGVTEADLKASFDEAKVKRDAEIGTKLPEL